MCSNDVFESAETLVPVEGLRIPNLSLQVPAVSVLPVLCLPVLTHLFEFIITYQSRCPKNNHLNLNESSFGLLEGYLFFELVIIMSYPSLSAIALLTAGLVAGGFFKFMLADVGLSYVIIGFFIYSFFFPLILLPILPIIFI